MTSKTISVFYVYKKVARFPKREYKALDKHTLRQNNAYVHSKAGLNDARELEIHVARKTKLFDNSNAVIVTDMINNPEQFNEPETMVTFLNIEQKPIPLEIFTITKEEDNYALWLNYSGNETLIGEPHRDDFYLLTLEKNAPVQIVINGINDTDDEGRFMRIYNELVYVIEYAGEIPVKPVKKVEGIFKREIPFKEAKTINLRRLFY